MGRNMTEADKAEVWRRYGEGDSAAMIARALGFAAPSVAEFIRNAGGIRPKPPCRSPRQLSLPEREEISRGLAAGESLRCIAGRLSRAPSTISREIDRNGGRRAYRALRAEKAARQRAKRPKPAKLAADPLLRAIVAYKLAKKWSPEQIAGWLARQYPDRPEMHVSHETIYRSLFVQSRGALRRELTRHLRSGRTVRRPIGHRGLKGKGGGKIVDAVHISERPPEAEDRAVPGHWEGDLLFGKAMSPIGTLVERTTRFVLLIKLAHHDSATVTEALSRQIQTLPEQLRRSLTWDQGLEMARHAQFTVDTGVQVFFCDPKSPWQRGSNENTNGLLRQYFPRKVVDFHAYTQADLDAVAAELNGRPRKTLDFMTPSEKYNEAVATTR
ncbi:MAG TPA: IS30 family transposase [Egibacteraceae bacterium]|nr:IS30 family transposase [Egibacteraceae bacterium]